MVSKLYSSLICISFAVVLSQCSQAELVTIENSGFEDPAVPDDTFITSSTIAPSGWDIYGLLSDAPIRQVGVLNPNSTALYTDAVPEGFNIGVVFLRGGSSEAGMQQTLSETLQANTKYTLTANIGNIATIGSIDFDGFPGYRIDLMAGGSVLATDNNSLLPGEGLFEETSFSFTTGSASSDIGENLGIRLVNLNGPGIEVNFDNIRLDATSVPEPSSFLMIAGLVTVFMISRRRQANNKDPKPRNWSR